VNAHSRRDDCVSGIKRVGDIGVGPIAIYPILGTALFHMDFIGSDINDQAVEHAKKTIQRNNLEHNIGIFLVGSTDHYQSLLWERLLSPSMNDQKSAAVVQLKSLILDASGRVNRGPLLRLLAEYCSTEVNACEERFLKGVRHICNDEKVVLSPSPMLDAVMTNPPFYTLDEEVR
jgi:16S rRNA G1207 methylase RsmC